MPRSDVPVARLRSSGFRLRPRPHHPHADGGPTHASNLKCYCRTHHLVKTFWGWRDQQLPDGTIILNSPSGTTYVTTPGSALLFPSLCRPTGELASLEAGPSVDYCGERTAMMPKRRRTHAQDRHRIASRTTREPPRSHAPRHRNSMSYFSLAPPATTMIRHPSDGRSSPLTWRRPRRNAIRRVRLNRVRAAVFELRS